MAVVISALVIALLIVVSGLTREARKHGSHVLAWRWLSGHSLDGHARTNATWFRRADKVLHPSGRVSRWHHLPRAHRAGIRILATSTLAVFTWGMIAARQVTILAAIMTGGLLIILGVVFGVRAGRRWVNNHTVVTPLAVALGPLLQIPDVAAQRAITLSPGYTNARDGTIGTIALPSQFRASPEQRAAVEHLVSSRLPVDTDFSWRTATANQQLIIKAAPKPPDIVRFADFRDVMSNLEPGQVMFGLDRKREPYFGSFNSDDPHWLASVASGRGKSTWLQITAAQLLHSNPGARFTGIDPKMSSFAPLAGVPGVRLANNPRDVAGMVSAINEVGAEMFRRLTVLDSDPTAEFPVFLLAMDELATFSVMLKTWWNTQRGPSDPATPPLWPEVIGPIHWMGRAANVHAISVSQTMYDRTCGGIGLRSSMGLRGLAGFRTREWDLVMGTRPVPRSQKPKGRWVYSVNDGSEPVWVQNLYGSAQEIRDWAIAGRTSNDLTAAKEYGSV